MATGRFDDALEKIATRELVKTCHRIVALESYEAGKPQRLLYDLGPKHTKSGQRFSPPGDHAGLYVALQRITAGSEYAGSAQEWHEGGGANSVGFKFQVKLAKVLDLTDVETLSSLGITPADVQGAWEGHLALFATEPLTWILGRAAFACGRFDGILFPSVKNSGGTNLLIFTERLVKGETEVVLFNSDGSVRERLPA